MSQIFRMTFDPQPFFDLLDKITIRREPTENHYVIDIPAFNKMFFLNLHNDFLKLLRPYYHHTKYEYLDRKLTYNSFCTIVRQICNHCNIEYSKKIVYFRSKHQIEYFIGGTKGIMCAPASAVRTFPLPPP